MVGRGGLRVEAEQGQEEAKWGHGLGGKRPEWDHGLGAEQGQGHSTGAGGPLHI